MEVIGIPSNLQSGYISYINLTQIKVNNNPIKHTHHNCLFHNPDALRADNQIRRQLTVRGKSALFLICVFPPATAVGCFTLRRNGRRTQSDERLGLVCFRIVGIGRRVYLLPFTPRRNTADPPAQQHLVVCVTQRICKHLTSLILHFPALVDKVDRDVD